MRPLVKLMLCAALSSSALAPLSAVAAPPARGFEV
jgi:hypothetical protein